MKPNKSPGCNGIGPEFYLKFWSVLEGKLIETYKYSLSEGELSQSQRRAVISLLHKKGKDEKEIKNWRPISLLNYDNKILTKVFAKRIEPFLSKLIHEDQSGFVKGRFIGENIRYLSDLIDYANEKQFCCILLSLDFFKAYDTVEWNFLLKCLERFNFGERFCKWIKTCYNNIFSTVMNNGFSGGWFQIFRGLRQGCPLSCILFILCIEICSCMIRENNQIQGIKVSNNEKKITQFADDTSCTVLDWQSFELIFTTVKIFSKHSGLTTNLDKSTILWLGPWKKKIIPKEYNLKVLPDNLDVLGLNIGVNVDKSEENNFHEKINKMEKRFTMWKLRNLTILGRILIAKTFGMSNHIYSMSILDIPQKIIKIAQQKINQFIWNEKNCKSQT